MKLPKTSKLILSLFNQNRLLILRSIYLCSQEKNICGCDLIESLKLPRNLLSYHLKFLKKRGYIEEVKCCKYKNYKIPAERMPEVDSILKIIKLI